MKTWTHPTTHMAKVTCTCWAKFSLLSILPEIKVETCSSCHSHYTWVQREENKATRVAKFRERQENAAKQAKK